MEKKEIKLGHNAETRKDEKKNDQKDETANKLDSEKDRKNKQEKQLKKKKTKKEKKKKVFYTAFCCILRKKLVSLIFIMII